MADSTNVTLRVLLLANQERNAYGLRTNDLGRYRKHCAGKTHRLRQGLKLTHGKGKEFKKTPPVAPENLKDGHLQLALFEAERAWAYSQELAAQGEDDSTLRHRATGRFRRALHHAAELQSHAQALFDSKRLSGVSLLEIVAYALILNARFLLRKDEFDPALARFCVARSILDDLASSASTSRDQALYTFYADEISAEIRYSAHSLGRSKAYDVDGIVADVSPKHRKILVPNYENILIGTKEGNSSDQGEKKKLKEIIWEGEPVPIRNPELVDVFLRVQEAEENLVKANKQGEKGKSKGKRERGKISSFDGVLLALSEAEEVARKLVEAQQLSGSSAAGTSAPGTAGVRDNHFIHAYAVYRLLSRRIERDLLLISSLLASPATAPSHQAAAGKGKDAQSSASKTDKVAEPSLDNRTYPALVKLLDTVLQSLEQMRSLSVVDESADLVSAIETRISFSKARRCFYIAKTYSVLKKYGESLALDSRAHLYLREARSTIDTSPTLSATDHANLGFYPLSSESIEQLEKDIAADELKFKDQWFTFNGGSVSTDPSAYKKPLFFDIAFNYAELPMERLLVRAGKAPPEPVPQPAQAAAPAPTFAAPADKKVSKAAEEKAPPPSPAPASGLSSLLGGWWGRK
ncbi:hypothetical protein BOTBODRAFT_185806 [Botryobasidium botryosum FD-172 SS1]|uniref:Signal recognition particle subunit SRP68 n=1 Tax=Botryobasidium botryosum (strain FD-172 SS1) TaxID=930990 RepID=A0A067MPN6_BOTB1|nr:hypothetical protein BOTBODRAFT_185806 [Botryobasidium botryosum FD-172 SS1]